MMKCHNPFVMTGKAFGCGQCLPCRINRRRIWTHRIKLEAAQYVENSFLTLTYADDMLPPLASLEPTHLRMFLYRVRTAARRSKELSYRQIRFFAVGEYGDVSERPHYHVMLFNFPGCLRGKTLAPPKYARCCFPCDFLYDLWYKDRHDKRPFGKIQLDHYSDALATYIGGYVTKKMTKKDDVRLNGRHPEFARQSTRPCGIGAGALHDVADVLLRYYDVAAELGDVPAVLDSGRARLPLGRYMRGKLREMVGMDAKAPESTLAKMEADMSPLRDIQFSRAKASLKSVILEQNAGKRSQVESRYKLFKQRRGL